MAETLEKLRPDHDLQCYFLRPTAAAALSGASATGFAVSGSWRQQFDWVVVEWNRDNTFEHPAFRNLPDGDLSGLVLTYDETRQNCIPIDSNLFPTVDWPSLRIWTDASGADPYKVPLKAHATPIAGSYGPATATFTLTGQATVGDLVELAWSEEHYTYQIQQGDSVQTVVQAVVNEINAGSPTMQAGANGAVITLTYVGTGQTLGTSTVGANGNRVGVYGNVKGAQTESWQPWFQQLSGGISPTTWRITLNFSSLSDENGNLIPTNSVRKLRWTYSADLQPGTYQRSEFQVTVANWTVTGSNLSYQVAGPASRRVEDTAPEVAYTGVWDRLPGTNVPVISTGNFSGGTIHSTSTPGDSLACTYTASQAHQLYLGTRKASNGTQITVVLDGNAPISLDLSLAGEDVLVRVPLGTLAGQRPHTVRITHAGTSSTYFYFDFLELAIPTATLPVFAANPKITLATDWDTDHSIALAPKRTAWMIQSLGFTGRANHYAGALWHYELVAQGFTYASATVTFSGTPDPSVPGAFTSISIGFQGSTSPPTVFQHLTLFGDTAASIAKAFELLINNGSTAIWAAASGNTLAITARAIGVAGGQITVAASSAMAGFTLTVSGTPLADGSYPLAGGQDGNWRTDLTAVPRMNRAARDWSRSFFRALAGYGITATAAFSMELQHGDPSPAAGIAQRYPSGNAVMLNTPALQTNFSPASTAFWQQAYLDLATLVVDAGQTPYLQFGEVQWWYFPDDKSGMPYYDAYTTTTFQATYGRTMTVFTGSNVDPSQYPQEVSFLSGLIAKFTSSIMSFVRQTYPNAKFEVLYPPDTNNSPLDTAVNLAPNWTPATLDCLKTENFTFTGNRNLDQAKSSILLPMQLGFPQSKSSHLVGITGYSTPWAKEARMALGQNLDSVVLFALDQFCLMACPVPPPKSARRALYMG